MKAKLNKKGKLDLFKLLVEMKRVISEKWDHKQFADAASQFHLLETPAMLASAPPSVRAEYYAARAELARLSMPPMTAEALAQRDAAKALLDQKEASKALEVRHVELLIQKGKELITAVIGVGDKYLSLCKAIRENEIAPKLVSFELTKLGFSRSTVSKINKVAGASDDLWNSFEARAFGFNKMLELSRSEKEPNEATKLLADSMGADVIDVTAQVQKLEGEEEEEGKQGEIIEATDEEKDEKQKLACERAAAVLGRGRVYFGWTKTKTFKLPDGWQVVVQKDTKWKAPKPTTAGGPKSPTMPAKPGESPLPFKK